MKLACTDRILDRLGVKAVPEGGSFRVQTLLAVGIA